MSDPNSPPWLTATPGESAFCAYTRKAFQELREQGCTISPAEFFPLAFGLFLVGGNDGAASQVAYAVGCAESALGLKVSSDPVTREPLR